MVSNVWENYFCYLHIDLFVQINSVCILNLCFRSCLVLWSLSGRYLYLRNEENLKPFIVLGENSLTNKAFWYPWRGPLYSIRKPHKCSDFFLNVAFHLPLQQTVYITFSACGYLNRSYSTAKFKLIPVWKKTCRNSRSYKKYFHSIFVYKAGYLLVSGFCQG